MFVLLRLAFLFLLRLLSLRRWQLVVICCCWIDEWPGFKGIGSPSAAQYTRNLSSSFLQIPSPNVSVLKVRKATDSIKTN